MQDAAARIAALSAVTETLRHSARVLIIGGGVVGVELAAEVVHYHPRAIVTVADVASRLLATLPRSASDAAADALRARGVRLLLGAPLTRVDPPLITEGGAPAPQHAFVAPSGEMVPADAVFMCVGARPNSACLMNSIPLDERGYAASALIA